MKTIIYQPCLWIPDLLKMDCHQLRSYLIIQSALIYPLLNHNLNLLLPKQQVNQKPKIDYQPWNLEVPSE